jgi:hypothetical protein
MTEQYHRIDIRVLHREGYLLPGSRFAITSSRAGDETGIIDGSAEPDYLVLIGAGVPGRYMPPGQIVKLCWTVCNYGGKRPWFVCPSPVCSRRVAILYDNAGSFACRPCCKLVYKSQRLPVDRRGLRQAQLIRIGAASRRKEEEFPGRPKGMHRRTYQLLRLQADRMGLPPRLWRLFAKSSARAGDRSEPRNFGRL